MIYGIGIVGGAFLLSWAAEVAQLDVSASLAIAVLALIAILPEYAIEAVLAMQAGASFNPELPVITDEMARVAANVTGANRLLIGLGWSLVILIYWLRRKQPLDMRGFMTLELPMLAGFLARQTGPKRQKRRPALAGPQWLVRLLPACYETLTTL